jgi:AmmeMemoRadiSam system protein A
MLETDDRQALLRLARAAIVARLEDRPLAAQDMPVERGGLAWRTGAFVTLTQAGRLRGCIGSVERDERLVDVVARCAADAATCDPRFSPLRLPELHEVKLEISVVGAFERVDDMTQIVVGRHGLVVEQGTHRGLLLPQVAAERRWDRDTFLGQTCVKAGLPEDGWRRGAVVHVFEALVFSE